MSWRLSSRSGRRGDPRWLLSAAAIAGSAAAAAYFFDPEHGHSRRTRIAERIGHLARRSSRRIARGVRYVSSSLAHRLTYRLSGARPGFAEGRTLLDRVESELFKNPAIPHGRILLEVEGITVVLRGQLDSRDEIELVESAVLKVPGVGKVRNLLHLSGTPAPNKLAALIASSQAAAEERWPEEPPPDVDSEAPIGAAVVTPATPKGA